MPHILPGEDIRAEDVRANIESRYTAVPADEAGGEDIGPPPRGKRRWLAGVLFCVFMAVFVFAAANIVTILWENASARGEYEDLRAYAPVQAPSSGDVSAARGAVGAPYILQPPAERGEPDIAALAGLNPDYAGWMQMDGTGIDYPVVRGQDNVRYLSTTFMGNTSRSGAIFMDYRCSEGFATPFTIIYGHNMQDGSMFSPLYRFLESDYIDAHPYIHVSTPDGQALVYGVFAAKQTTVDDAVFGLVGYGAEDAAAYFAQYGAPATGHYLVLSTCTNSSNDDERVLLFAALL